MRNTTEQKSASPNKQLQKCPTGIKGFDDMLLSAQAAGCADFVMPLDKIPAKLKSLAVTL